MSDLESNNKLTGPVVSGSPNVRRMFEEAKHLEQQIRNAPISQSASHTQVLRKTRLKLRDLYYAIIQADFEYATAKEVELFLWKSCFYKPANDYRNACKKAYRSVTQYTEKQEKEKERERSSGGNRANHSSSGSSGNSLSRAKDGLSRVCQEFKAFLEESSIFYQAMIQQLAETYQLNLEYPNAEGSKPLMLCAYMSCHRAYIYLGDLMRYHRDLHHDPTQKNWTQATVFYQHAIRLYPDSGHPYNQLAVMCTHKDFEFKTLCHYYRALFARVPFPGTRENLASLLERNRAKFQQLQESPEQQQNLLETFLLSFVRLHGIAFCCKGAEAFSAILLKALHLFERLIQHGSIKATLVMQLFVVNVSTLYNAMNLENADQSALSVRLSLTLLISFFANLLYQYLVLPQEKLRFYRNFYKPISLIASWLSTRSFFLAQPSDQAQRLLWAKLRELFTKVVTKILAEGLPDENIADSLAPTSEDIDFRGFLPLQILAENHKVDFSLAPLSGSASDHRRRERIIQFAFFACQTVWNEEESFIYFDRANNVFTVLDPAKSPTYNANMQQEDNDSDESDENEGSSQEESSDEEEESSEEDSDSQDGPHNRGAQRLVGNNMNMREDEGLEEDIDQDEVLFQPQYKKSTPSFGHHQSYPTHNNSHNNNAVPMHHNPMHHANVNMNHAQMNSHQMASHHNFGLMTSSGGGMIPEYNHNPVQPLKRPSHELSHVQQQQHNQQLLQQHAQQQQQQQRAMHEYHAHQNQTVNQPQPHNEQSWMIENADFSSSTPLRLVNIPPQLLNSQVNTVNPMMHNSSGRMSPLLSSPSTVQNPLHKGHGGGYPFTSSGGGLRESPGHASPPHHQPHPGLQQHQPPPLQRMSDERQKPSHVFAQNSGGMSHSALTNSMGNLNQQPTSSPHSQAHQASHHPFVSPLSGLANSGAGTGVGGNGPHVWNNGSSNNINSSAFYSQFNNAPTTFQPSQSATQINPLHGRPAGHLINTQAHLVDSLATLDLSDSLDAPPGLIRRSESSSSHSASRSSEGGPTLAPLGLGVGLISRNKNFGFFDGSSTHGRLTSSPGNG